MNDAKGDLTGSLIIIVRCFFNEVTKVVNNQSTVIGTFRDANSLVHNKKYKINLSLSFIIENNLRRFSLNLSYKINLIHYHCNLFPYAAAISNECHSFRIEMIVVKCLALRHPVTRKRILLEYEGI